MSSKSGRRAGFDVSEQQLRDEYARTALARLGIPFDAAIQRDRIREVLETFSRGRQARAAASGLCDQAKR